MKKFILLILSVIFLSLLGIVVWMNLTPGYFQYGGCGCGVDYFTDAEARAERNQPVCALVGVCFGSFWDKPLLFLSRLDFNRGPEVTALKNEMAPQTDRSNGWLTYSGSAYEFRYPANWGLCNKDSDDYINVCLTANNGTLGSFTVRFRGAPLPSAKEEEVIRYIQSYDIFSTSAWGDSQPYEQVKTTVGISGQKATKYVYGFKNLLPVVEYQTMSWYILPYQNKFLTIEAYGKDLKVLDQILGSFKFFSQAKPSDSNRVYVCPKTEWVNCMPMLTPESQKFCTKEFLSWAKNNCPNFKGAAY